MPRIQVHQESATLAVSDALLALGFAAGKRPSLGRREWEAAISRAIGGPAIAVTSGRGAIALALLASRLASPLDEVIVTGFTCVAVPAGVAAGGGTPVYADVDSTTGNLTPETVRTKITDRTGAVVVQHFLGNPAPTEAIRRACGPTIWVIEDLAHALGSRINGELVGLHGDWAIISTEQSKCLSTGQGGLLVAISERARNRMPALPQLAPPWTRTRTNRWLTRVSAERLAFGLTPFGWPVPGQLLVRALHRAGLASVSSRDAEELQGGMADWRLAPLPDALAELGIRQLARAEPILERRRLVARSYDLKLAGIGQRLQTAPGAEPVWLRYPILVDDAEAISLAMARFGWALGGRWFSTPIYPPETSGRAVGYRRGDCPQAELLSTRILNLPTHPLASERLVDRLARDLRMVLGA